MNERKNRRVNAGDQIPTRKSLLGRLKNWEDNRSWKEFFDTYWKLIYNFALQRGLTHQEAEEVVQETVVAVARSIERFEYDPARCSFKTWLLTVTRSKISNQFAHRARRERFESNGSDTDADLENLPDPAAQQHWEQSWDDEWRLAIADAAIQRVRQRASIKQFQMFDLFVLKGWSAREVAKSLGVTIAHVYVAKHRISRWVQKEAALIDSAGLPIEVVSGGG
jgi:RNA polymerase sigma factor (sigma-70 family)